ncbi:TPA: enhanced entry protein EnhB, partial [Legionella pneumophila subsp. pneumophila]|nr:enhanced entry protein EnhB [Legionella pneumophila subsp. pneumophila]HAT9588259.1 enhanced entry protein EnhB [Legionella pneumophila subsp. pneumophila]
MSLINYFTKTLLITAFATNAVQAASI